MTETTDLGDRLEAFVSELVLEGRYHSRADVLKQSVLLLEERERRIAAFDAEIDRGLGDIDAGGIKPAHEVFDRLEAKYHSASRSYRGPEIYPRP